jgi:hypothetical protein
LFEDSALEDASAYARMINKGSERFKLKEKQDGTDTNVIEQSNAELREHWGNLASNFLVGKTIRRVRYLNDSEREDIGWINRDL